MPSPEFTPGFRISAYDVILLVIGTLSSWLLWSRILWLGFVNEMEGPIFRGVSNNHELTRGLGPGQVNRIYKNAARKAQLDEGVVQNISGHSCRVGAAQDLLTAGASLPMIMKKGRWVKTDTVMRYVEHASVTN